MGNPSLNKVPMPEQPGYVRSQNFEEVSQGYTKQMALEEAARCLHCKNSPCISGCPVHVNIPAFIRLLREGNFAQAYQCIAETNSLPAVCGRVCPQERQCEAKCVRGIKGEPVAIGRLERFAADWHMKNACERTAAIASNGKKVAVIGAGPAGLSCAGDLAKAGYSVTIFEAFHKAGGVLVYGIPEFRLPKDIVAKEVWQLQQLGVEIKTDMVIGKILSIDELQQMGYDAIFVGSGAGLPRFMNIPGEGLMGVYSANEFLTRVNLMKAYKQEYDTPIHKSKKVVVVGGGNVAMDAARCAKRLGAEEVTIVYRRSEDEMPARKEEIHHAKEEGIRFQMLTNPVRIMGDEYGQIRAMECVRMELGEPDASGRRAPKAKQGSEFILEADGAIIAVGTSPNPLIRTTAKGIEANSHGCLVVDENMQTTRQGVYAGGDAVTGAATVILAMGAGKTAAKAIDEYLSGRDCEKE